MENSIQHFNEISTEIFADLMGEFFKSPKDIASFIRGVTEELHKVGILLVKETLEIMDEMICNSGKRALDWTVERHTEKKLITSLGSVHFTKTLFENKKTREMCYLLDRILGLEKGDRITEDALAKIYEEAVQSSYRRAGDAASILDTVSKQTVKNKLHTLQFPQVWKEPQKKKAVDYLYIEADEDHVSLQFQQKKGDLELDAQGHKINNIITKLVYVHEGIAPEAPKSKRYKLINPYYFCATADGKTNEEFWNDVYHYVDAQYDLDKVKKIYVNSDGGGWIRSGLKQISGLVHVLDGYHLSKSIGRLTHHMKDSADDTKEELEKAICQGTKEEFRELASRLEEYFPDGEPTERFKKSRDYILGNWTAARYRLKKVEGVVGSSTEGHVYHALSCRMSTQPMGWSKKGASKMAQLRAYYLNGGDMLELARYQRQEVPKAAGAEERVGLSASDVWKATKSRHGIAGKYHDAITHSISLQNRKKVYFQTHIWGL